MTKYIITFFLTLLTLLPLCVTIFVYKRSQKTLDMIDSMLDSAIAGTFTESSFTEKKLSKIESKLYRYLNKGRMSEARINSEKDAIKTLISDISHQTKTPLSNILIYSQLLCENESLGSEAKNSAVQIEAQAEKLSFLIASLIKISRLENDIMQINAKRNSVNALISSLDFEKLADEKGVSLKIAAPCGDTESERDGTGASDIFAYFDFKWTLEALGNIVDNAIKYTPAGGSVTISAKEYEMFACIDVTDTGIGISESDSAKIFSRFYRAEAVSEKSGVGIGLYLAREIVTRNGGYIKVISEIGCGSKFSVFLPKQPNLSEL